MGTARWAKNPWSLNNYQLSTCLTATIVVTAETNDNYIVLLLGFVDHIQKCLAHRWTILFVPVRLDEVN
jgi:hypothetical protein